jgi:ribosomal protein S18 acetylase RimI-like enzyme
LYTGRSNPAIHIYEKAGFKTVKEFAVMRREFSK